MTTHGTMIEAIRSDPLVGRGTCSCIDECMSDSELAAELARDGSPDGVIDTEAKAIRWARDQEELHLEMALDARWGGDDDPQLRQYREWKKRRKELEADRKAGDYIMWRYEDGNPESGPTGRLSLMGGRITKVHVDRSYEVDCDDGDTRRIEERWIEEEEE